MKTVRISLNSIDKVKSFVNDLTKFDVDFDLVSGRYVIDAKSIMGIFSLVFHQRDFNRSGSIYHPLIDLLCFFERNPVSRIPFFLTFYCLPAFDHFYGLQRSLHQLIDLLRQIFL